MKRIAILAVCALGGLAGCSQIEVTAEHDPTVDFRMFRTYDWIDHEPAVPEDPRIDPAELDRWVRTDIGRALQIRGFDVDGANPDLLVGYRAARAGDTEILRVAGSGSVDTYVRNYDKGALVVDLLDAGTGELLWSATAMANVDLDTDSKRDRRERITEAVRLMFDELPVRAGTNVRAYWVHDDGARVPDAEVDAAIAACEAEGTAADSARSLRRAGYRAWGGEMLRCLASKDVHLGAPPTE